MTTQSWATGMVINTRFISQEILINCKCSFDWAVVHDFSLDFLYIGRDWVDWRGNPFILTVWFTVSWCACFFARWSWFAVSAWLILSSSVVITWGESVGLAPIASIIKPSSNYTSSVEVIPGSRRISSITSISTSQSATSKKVFRGNSNLEGLVASNTNSVAHCLDSSKSPAWTASALVSNFFDWFTFRPVSGWKELIWNVHARSDILFGELEVTWGFQSSH